MSVAKDKGDKYDDSGELGSYCTSEVQFPNPEGTKVFSGYGASEADLELGFIRPAVRELPEYDKASYQDRWTLPKETKVEKVSGASFMDSFEESLNKRRSKGFLIRPRTPTERG